MAVIAAADISSNARIGYDDVIESLSATASVAHGPARAAGYWTTYERWITTTSATLTGSFGEQEIDYIGILHHMATDSVVEIETGGVWTEVESHFPGPEDALLILIDPVTATGVRITGTGSVSKLAAGKILTMARPFFAGHAPGVLNRQTRKATNISERGEWLGASIVHQGVATTMSWDHLPAEWYRANFDPFADHATEHPFFAAWNPREYPDCLYCVTDDIQPSNSGRDWMSVDMAVKSILIPSLRYVIDDLYVTSTLYPLWMKEELEQDHTLAAGELRAILLEYSYTESVTQDHALSAGEFRDIVKSYSIDNSLNQGHNLSAAEFKDVVLTYSFDNDMSQDHILSSAEFAAIVIRTDFDNDMSQDHTITEGIHESA